MQAIESMNRRRFLSACAGAAGCGLCAGACNGQVRAAPSAAAKAKLRLVYSHPAPGVEGWPNVGYDFEGRKTALTARLRSACPNIEFLPAAVPRTPEDTGRILAADAEVDGYVLYLLGLPSSPVAPLTGAGRPVVVVNDLYGGGIGTMHGPRVALVSSSSFDDVVQAVRTFEHMARLRSSVLLDVVNRAPGEAKAIQETFGTRVEVLSADELSTAYEKSDPAESRKWAGAWIRTAERIVEPSEEEIGKSGRMYVAMRNLLQERGAQGIAVDCLTLFYAGKMPAYPCLGFFQLNNDGQVGACEADIQSAITMLAMTYATGRPGYISDPVIDTSKNQIVYAHCVAPTRVFGPRGNANAFHIRSHSEDRKGACVRSLMPVGHVVTSLKFVPSQKVVVMHTAKTVANIDDDKACRTKLAAGIPNAQKMLEGWSQGWHRVTVYGDYRKRVKTLSALLGFKVVEEDA
jgi:L-fucose isomerase-like protein